MLFGIPRWRVPEERRVSRFLLVAVMLFSVGCGYGPERTTLSISNVVAKPDSYQLAVSVEYARVREPTGVLNTFPNGGTQKVLFREARVYLCDFDRGAVNLVAAIPDFAGIPQPKSVSIEGWRDDRLYFSLFGYGGNDWSGDDLSDERRLFYQVTADGEIDAVGELPDRLERGRNTGPAESPPFLRWSQGHLEVVIALDARVGETTRLARLTFETESGDPRLSMP